MPKGLVPDCELHTVPGGRIGEHAVPGGRIGDHAVPGGRIGRTKERRRRPQGRVHGHGHGHHADEEVLLDLGESELDQLSPEIGE